MAGWSGDYVCNSCGEILTSAEVKDIEARHSKPDTPKEKQS
jgi:hypothetical protein